MKYFTSKEESSNIYEGLAQLLDMAFEDQETIYSRKI